MHDEGMKITQASALTERMLSIGNTMEEIGQIVAKNQTLGKSYALSAFHDFTESSDAKKLNVDSPFILDCPLLRQEWKKSTQYFW